MEICTVGGFEEVGKNMTAVKVGNDVFIFDVGLYLPAIIELQEQESQQERYTERKLRSVGAIPDDKVLDKLGWADKVRAICIGHTHLDHVGGVPYIAGRYPKAPILATPFTIEVLESILRDEKISLKNKRVSVNPNSSFNVKGESGEYKIEFVHATHSTLQSTFVALHTKEGVFLYTLDFKFDKHPVIGDPPNYKRLHELSKKGIKVAVVDSLYSGAERRTASERIARNLIQEAISNCRGKNTALIVTTFSSHIARLKSIVDFGKKTNREIIFLGRSLNKYVQAAQNIKKCPFIKDIKIIKYKKQVNSFLKNLEKNRGNYLIVCTGHQAEPGSILDRMVNDKTPFKFKDGDNVIFSSSVIPAAVNINSRDLIDKKLRKKGVRIQTDIHVSGHGGREDIRDLIEITKPKHIIPAHGSLQQETPMIELATELGYKFQETVHLSSNGKVINL